ncbi:IS6 family transposase [Acinetobacter ursingii]|nr:IS6 family transposase [Acinetobacter ursingii]MDG9861788.1 IS6 family transposase [Acinetobacter ursingii]MDH0008700.1 IS6 family transposase [Acinetobacter ursingii]MDH0480735.1 IS6 family transposase [Acinetobacter ursingii]
MNPFHGRHFQGEIILWAVRWYCKYGISYRELQEMLAERGVNVDHTTIYRWVQRYAPEMEKRLRWYWRNPTDRHSWHMDETYVKVNGKWAYLYRADDQRGHTLDFYLSARRNTHSAYCFLGKIFNQYQSIEHYSKNGNWTQILYEFKTEQGQIFVFARNRAVAKHLPIMAQIQPNQKICFQYSPNFKDSNTLYLLTGLSLQN